MIDRLLDRARGKVDGADALWRRDEQTAVAFESGRLKTAGISEETGLNLRVLAGGRMGVAGTTAAKPDPDALVERARASAELGEVVELEFPGAAASNLPRIPTFFDRTANASLAELIRMGRLLVERLARPDCQVNVSVQREVQDTAVANTAGARGEYRATGIAVTADLTRIAGDDVLMVYDQYVGADMPSDADLEALVRSVETRLTAALQVVTPPDGALPVVFTPAGLAAVVLPLEQALSGKTVLQGSSPLAGKVGEAMFDERLSIFDDPLTPGRPASRPVDDECVPSRATGLVERGTVGRFVYDLETAARAKTQSTGNGRRGVFGKPHIGYTNIVFRVSDGGHGGGVGAQHAAPLHPLALGGGLIEDIDDGLIVDDLIGVGQGNVISGAFSHPVGLAYRVQRGEVTGRVKDAAVA
ncbi:MAG TPA: TldD/PmbA family protein, partial [Vicinamibacterales bacterium]|nr:TldD/PmbA family protein [Vicinamibacterales bacterium]